MGTLIVLLWMLISINCVRGQDKPYEAMQDTVNRVYNDSVNEIMQPIDVYQTEIVESASAIPSAVIIQNTHTSLYILDICGYFQFVINNQIVGLHLSYFLNVVQNYKAVRAIQQMSDADTFLIRCYDIVSFSYNISLIDSENGTIIAAVATNKWSGTTLGSLLTDKPSQFMHVKRVVLSNIPITELTVEGFMRFPELETLVLTEIPITQMEEGLLCVNVNITILFYLNSLGSLTEFPRHIFNCPEPLKLAYFQLVGHNIAHLPARAFGSAAKQLRYVALNEIGLEVIDEDAFKGMIGVQFLSISGNKLSQLPDTVLLPFSTHLRTLQIIDDWYDGVLNLTSVGIAEQNELQRLVWMTNHVSLVGNFCANTSHSELKMIQISSKISVTKTFPADIFDHCVSLKLLLISNYGLVYLPERLFSTNVSQLETLELVGNRLNSNVSWSDVLMPLHELKYLNLSGNMLTSWTYNLSSLWELKILDLSHNVITEISQISFMNMTRLNFLSLEDNNLAFLAPEVQGIFTRLAVVHFGSNSLTQLNLPHIKQCTPQCDKISLFADNNFLSSFLLSCSNTQQYATLSLTNNWLTNFTTIFPDVYVQQCSIEILNVSGNSFRHWSVRYNDSFVNFYKNGMVSSKTHGIKILDMTYCQMIYINEEVFLEFTIEFLDLRWNSVYSLPMLNEGWPYPNIVDIRFNPTWCTCATRWVKQYLEKKTFDTKNEIRVTHCMDLLWNTTLDILKVPESMFLCNVTCPQQIQQQCDKERRCYRSEHTEIDAVVCLSSGSINRLSPNLMTLHQLHASGFNLATLEFPNVKAHKLSHLNLTSCSISIVPETAFINIPHLEFLVLGHNVIQTLASGTFHPLNQLKYLDLSYNQLLSFDGELIVPLFLLETLYLHHNKLKQLSLETLEEFKILDTLSLHSNPWICDCNDTFGHWIVQQQQSRDFLLSPENITCDRTDIPVMFSNVTCTTHTKVHVTHPGSKAAIIASSVLASVLAVTLVVCILIYKYRLTLSVLAFIYMPRCTRRKP